jgi:hypothetical protein
MINYYEKDKIFEISCDHCSVEFETFEVDDFQDGIDEAKALGWKIGRARGIDDHTCPDCQEK